VASSAGWHLRLGGIFGWVASSEAVIDALAATGS
jgi:hypothetical protein